MPIQQKNESQHDILPVQRNRLDDQDLRKGKVQQINKQAAGDWKQFIKSVDENKQKLIKSGLQGAVNKLLDAQKTKENDIGRYDNEAEIEFAKQLKDVQILKSDINRRLKSNYQKIILIITDLHEYKEWPNLPSKDTKDYLKNKRCIKTNCEVSYDKKLFPIADAVIFHERNLPSVALLEAMNKRRPPYQRWIFFTSETPLNNKYGIIPFNGYFNWTMTYKLDSDIVLPYLFYRKVKKEELSNTTTKVNYAATKKHKIAWLVSNCNFGFRMEFAHLLDKYVDVHVGGNCRDDFPKNVICSRYCDQQEIRNYKFFLSFENGMCTDYISEKYWRYLELGLVPIVLGGANYSNPRLAIPGSFIDASKFDSVQELANYINYLDKNDKEYNKYFEWKEKYKVWRPNGEDWPFESYFTCTICQKLDKNIPEKIYQKLSDFWSSDYDCRIPEEKLTKKFIPEGYSWEQEMKIEQEKERLERAKVPKDWDEASESNIYGDRA